jgi:hypothetical protein
MPDAGKVRYAQREPPLVCPDAWNRRVSTRDMI